MDRPGLEKGEERRMAGACEHCSLDTKEPLKISLMKVRPQLWPQLDASGRGGSGLNDNVLYRIRCWSTWSPVGGTCVGKFRDFRLARGSMLLGLDFEVSKPHATCSLCFLLVTLDVNFQFQLLLPCLLPRPYHDGLLAIWTCKPQINPVFWKLPWSWCFIAATEK